MSDGQVELVAIGPDPSLRWHRTLPVGQSVRLGRLPQDGWAVPWDQRISREHADLIFENGELTIQVLEAAKNPVHFFDDTQRELTVGPGDEFRIGVTRFRVVTMNPDGGDNSVTVDENLAELIRKSQPVGEGQDILFAGKAKSEDGFDPYHRWLGIPPEDQPPHAYRLLGITTFEEVGDVIQAAADRQMAHVRGYQTGQRSELSQMLLNELTSARLMLLTPEKKQRYDILLRDHFAQQEMSNPVFDTGPRHDPVDNLAGEACGNYVLLDHLCSGEMGSVFKAKHAIMDRIVALKVLFNEGPGAREAIQRFNQQIKTLSNLNHKNLVAAYEAGERDGTHFLVMEFVDGCDLVGLLKQRGTLSIDEVIEFAIQAAEGLGYAHASGVIHRNVKPNKLLLDQNGTIKVVGWGRALLTSDTPADESNAKTVVGTFEYMSPEQSVDSDAVDHRADIYSLGCTIFTLLTRRLLFPTQSVAETIAAHRNTPPPLIQHIRSDAPPSLVMVLRKMLAKQPESRFQSMAQVIAGLQAVLHSSGPQPPIVEPAPSPAPAEARSRPSDSTSMNLADFFGNLSEDERETWKRKRK